MMAERDRDQLTAQTARASVDYGGTGTVGLLLAAWVDWVLRIPLAVSATSIPDFETLVAPTCVGVSLAVRFLARRAFQAKRS